MSIMKDEGGYYILNRDSNLVNCIEYWQCPFISKRHLIKKLGQKLYPAQPIFKIDPEDIDWNKLLLLCEGVSTVYELTKELEISVLNEDQRCIYVFYREFGSLEFMGSRAVLESILNTVEHLANSRDGFKDLIPMGWIIE